MSNVKWHYIYTIDLSLLSLPPHTICTHSKAQHIAVAAEAAEQAEYHMEIVRVKITAASAHFASYTRTVPHSFSVQFSAAKHATMFRADGRVDECVFMFTYAGMPTR